MMEKSCKNCRYYAVHYVKSNQNLLKLSEGHCVNNSLFPAIKNRKKIYTDCKFWEPVEIKIAERKKHIKEVLRNMEKSLEDIRAILQSDRE